MERNLSKNGLGKSSVLRYADGTIGTRKIRGIKPLKDDSCYYCGLQATQIDHVVPKSTLKLLSLSTVDITMDILKNRSLKVHSCRECNSVLSNSLQATLAERKKELKKRLRKRKRLLILPDAGGLLPG